MNKEDNVVNFDLSTLTLEELIRVYEEINEFLDTLNDSKIVFKEKVDDEDE